ncbi:GxxExxY protein [Flavobacterium filum]|uniref:GxxExxY protein n=1 Tax=Flavobacterium TaxID=237 RepID=UPI0003FCB0E6|nr:GxxExxY protein [Flavobacterium filum]
MTKKEVTQLSYDIVGCAITVHKTLGPGLLESVYEKCLQKELEYNGFQVETQKKVKLEYRDLLIETKLRLDLIVNNTVVVEIKTVENLLPVHEAQLLTYMSLLEKPQGLLINFYTDNISKSVKPMVNEYFKMLNP